MRSSFANASNTVLLEENFQRWKNDPLSVDSTWSAFFEGFELGCAEKGSGVAEGHDGKATDHETPLQTRVDGLVYGYRTLGHSVAKLDPLEDAAAENPLLSLRELGFSEKDMELDISSKFYLGGKKMKLREMIESLRATYAGTIGFEFMHIQNSRVRNWVRERIESRDVNVPREGQIAILRTLMEAESFERFLHTKYIGQKRFSLEGGESLMVALETFVSEGVADGVVEIVMGMAHRGRLTVLANYLRKSLNVLFAEFSENYVPDLVGGDGDVKYHLGYISTREFPDGKRIGIRLSPNPSHLEAVNPVVEGMARARQRILDDTTDRVKVLPLLVHGDGAFAGQGIVAETLNLSQLPGYRTGGTIHFIVNNQIGFTTLPADARSSSYCSDVAKMIEAPIFHVNADDPLAVAYVARLAFEFRQTFHRDVVVDMYCYRRHGHNEGDEPIYTQPDLYAVIKNHPSTATLFKQHLVASRVLTEPEALALDDEFEKMMETSLFEVRKAEEEKSLDRFSESSAVFQPPYSHDPVDTSIPRERLEQIVKTITQVPDGFAVLDKVRRILLERRKQVFLNGGPYDWAYAEHLAFGSLLLDGTAVRLSGQDSRRGTFSQRHSVLYDANTRERYIPLMHLAPDQARFCVYNSLLSEAAVLGFDYGYSLDYPQMLCLWEAQFGDFANGAQVITDQFISSSESKWQRPSGIIMLLPHGYEGQGPEHSSARLERFLTLCAEENIQVCNLTTPAQYFHMLRRQMMRPFRKPLILMTPKSLLRAEACVSTEADFTSGRFHEILEGPAPKDAKKVKRVIFCAGKVYYDLLNYRETNRIGSAAIVRVEQFYPLHEQAIQDILAGYSKTERFVWCQEEPQNMGAWSFISPRLRQLLGAEIGYAGRGASASTAVGAKAIHIREQQELVEQAFTV